MALPTGLAHALDGVRRRHIGLKLAEFPVFLTAFLALAWILQGTADRFLELSWNLRAALLVLNGIAALVLLWFFAIQPLRLRLDRRRAALLVERTMPEFRTSLISAVELSEKSADFPQGSRPLVEKLLQDTAREVTKTDLVRRVVPMDRLKHLLKWLAAVLVLATICFLVARPLSPLLMRRILLSKAAFPDETKVLNMTGDGMVIEGSDVSLSARAEGKIPAAGRLIISLANGRTETIAVSASRTEAGVFQHTMRNVREPFGYRFELNDGVGPSHRVSVRVPPTLRKIDFLQVYPGYTKLPETTMNPPVMRWMAGSKVKISAIASGPLESALLKIEGTAGESIPLTLSGESKSAIGAELTVPETGWKSMSIRMTAADGYVSVNDPVYRVELVKDKPPLIVLTQPKKDSLTVVEGAKIPFAFKITDDLKLERARLKYRVFRPTLAQELEPAEEGEVAIFDNPSEKSISRTMEWELARLVPPVTAGSSITCWIEARDNNPVENLRVSSSSERVIAVVSEEQKRLELLELLGQRAADIERLYELQRGMNQKTDDSIR